MKKLASLLTINEVVPTYDYIFVPNFEAIGHVTWVLDPENRPASLA